MNFEIWLGSMKKLIEIVFILVFIPIIGCSFRKKLADHTISNSKEQYPQVIIGDFKEKNDPFKIHSIHIDHNFIEIEVSYSGGCQKHDFQLIGSEIIKNSNPSLRNVQLVHDNKGDICKAIVTEKLKFSISNLAENYESGNKVNLQFENNKQILEYSYE